MLKIISKNKHGNKIISYTVSDGSQSKQLTKDQVTSLIKQHQISNATIQNYKNQVIIRVKDIPETKANYKQTPANKSKASEVSLSREQQLYEASKNIYNRWKLSNLPFEKLIQAWNQYCKQVDYTDPFEYNIDTPEYRGSERLDFDPDYATNLIVAKYTKKSNISKGTILPYFVQSTFSMFGHCIAQSLDLSSFNTSNVTDMTQMFKYCGVKSLDLSSFNTSNVTNMRYMFYECRAQSIDLSSFNTSNVINMAHMFFECQAQSLDLSSFNTSKVTDMNHMFGNCQVQSLDLSYFNTSNVTNMSYMFYYCQAQSLDISSFNTSKVTNMKSMFCCCQAQSLDLSSFNTSKVTDIRSMFYECEAQSILLSKSCENLSSKISNDTIVKYK